MNEMLTMLHLKARRGISGDTGWWAIRPRQIVIAIACVVGMCMTVSANAACSFASGGLATGTVNFGNVNVPTNVAVGTVIARTSASYGTLVGTQTYTCGNGNTTVSFLMSGAGASGTYPTNIPGVGVRVTLSSSGAWGVVGSYVMPYAFSFNYAGASGFSMQSMTITTELLVTGPISLGGTNALSYNVSPWMTIALGGSQLSVSNLAVVATLALASCSVTTPSVAVTLPTVFPGNFATGSAGNSVFNLSVSCPSGINVNVTLTDASNVSNRSTTLALAPGSSATGVGLRILRGSNLVAFGSDSAVAGNTNQWFAGTATGGPMNIPLTVQYVRTSGTLTPGTVNGLATFTMSYQ